MVNRIVISICILVFTFQKGYSQEYAGRKSPQLIIEYQSLEQEWKITNNSGKINIRSDITTRSVYLSDNEKYVLITYGTDVVGIVQIYEAFTGKKLYSSLYSGKEPCWDNNKVSFECVEWVGDGITVRKKIEFDNGLLNYGKQYIGPYHGYDDRPREPLHPLFDINEYGNMENIIDNFLSYIKYYTEKYPIITENIIKEYQISQISETKIYKSFDYAVMLINYTKMNPSNIYEIPKIFSRIYLLILKSNIDGIIENKEANKRIKILLKIMGIDYEIVPWLIVKDS